MEFRLTDNNIQKNYYFFGRGGKANKLRNLSNYKDIVS